MDLTIPGTIPSEKLAFKALPASLNVLPILPKSNLPRPNPDNLFASHSNALPTASTTGLRKDKENFILSNLSAYSLSVGHFLRIVSPKDLNENSLFSNHFERSPVPFARLPNGFLKNSPNPFLTSSNLGNLNFIPEKSPPISFGTRVSQLRFLLKSFHVLISPLSTLSILALNCFQKTLWLKDKTSKLSFQYLTVLLRFLRSLSPKRPAAESMLYVASLKWEKPTINLPKVFPNTGKRLRALPTQKAHSLNPLPFLPSASFNALNGFVILLNNSRILCLNSPIAGVKRLITSQNFLSQSINLPIPSGSL